ncbi:hypothetical protein ACEWY4_008640 [Coilia grayii]|uniref:Uncharacterized protein n=1 Tax=Coilia grayii TaxID=363190 RepID=A0ABD1KBH5_9TELE
MASGHPTDKFTFLYQPDSSQNLKSKNRLSSTMNPVYSPVQPGTPYGNPKNMAYTGYPSGYPTTAPTYTPNLYQTGSPGYPPVLLVKQSWPQTASGPGATDGSYDLAVDAGSESRQYQASSAAFRYTAGTPYKVPPHPEQWSPPTLLPVSQPLPSCHVPHQKCLSPAEPLCSGCLLHTARVCGPATCNPPHHRGAAQQHPLCHLPCARPRPALQRGGHGHGGRNHDGYVRRHSAHHSAAYPYRSTSCHRANIPAPRNPWIQLRATSLVELICHIISGVQTSYATTRVLHGRSVITMETPRLFARTKEKKCKGHFMHS